MIDKISVVLEVFDVSSSFLRIMRNFKIKKGFLGADVVL